MNFKYYIPTKILFGRGQLANLHKEKLPGTRALIVTTGGRSVVDNGYLARTEEELKAAGCTFVLFNKITANPDRSEVMDLSLIHIFPPLLRRPERGQCLQVLPC